MLELDRCAVGVFFAARAWGVSADAGVLDVMRFDNVINTAQGWNAESHPGLTIAIRDGKVAA